MAEYTVKAVMPTGKSSPTYGTQYHIQLNEAEGSFLMWFKAAPEVGKTIAGTIEGSKFKKEKKQWQGKEESSGSPSGSSPAPRRSYKDNSDGMRQGMCMNNAAAYINTLEFPKALTDKEWAELVHDYASALYQLGDLKGDPITAETVAGVFGGGTT